MRALYHKTAHDGAVKFWNEFLFVTFAAARRICRALLRLDRRVAHPDLVEALRPLQRRRDNRIARFRGVRRVWQLVPNHTHGVTCQNNILRRYNNTSSATFFGGSLSQFDFGDAISRRNRLLPNVLSIEAMIRAGSRSGHFLLCIISESTKCFNRRRLTMPDR